MMRQSRNGFTKECNKCVFLEREREERGEGMKWECEHNRVMK